MMNAAQDTVKMEEVTIMQGQKNNIIADISLNNYQYYQ